jgi:long-chain acyl-CoA synthetase
MEVGAMRECRVAERKVVDPQDTVPKVYMRRVAQQPGRVLVRRRRADGWHDMSAEEFAADVDSVAAGLIACGVRRGDRVALMSATRYEWTLLDCAIMSAAAVTVPIYETSSVEQVRWILQDSAAVGVVVDSPVHEATVLGLRADLPDLEHVWSLDGGGVAEIASEATGESAEQVDRRRRESDGSSLATIVYTSGTTGMPKGCPLTHSNMLAVANGVLPGALDQIITPNAATLIFLPLAHVAARLVQTGCLVQGAAMGHWSDLPSVVDELQSFQPDFIVGVPRVFEKVYNAAATKAAAENKAKIFAWAAATAIEYSTAMDTDGPSPWLRIRHAIFDRLVYAKLRARLGGRASAALCGAAPLGARLGHFFRGIGLPIYEVYGETECFGLATISYPGAIRVGAAGRPIAGGAIRIGDDGEILIDGPHVFDGYWHNADATAEALPGDGWLHSGDIGKLDESRFLHITGRKKDLIVTSSGKNVAPAVLEDVVRAHPMISEIMVVGDNRPFVAALVTLDPAYLRTWLELHDRDADTPAAELIDDDEVRAEVQDALDRANAAVSRAESIRSFRILPTEFTVEDGQLTPSLKLMRGAVADQLANEISSLYA